MRTEKSHLYSILWTVIINKKDLGERSSIITIVSNYWSLCDPCFEGLTLLTDQHTIKYDLWSTSQLQTWSELSFLIFEELNWRKINQTFVWTKRCTCYDWNQKLWVRLCLLEFATLCLYEHQKLNMNSHLWAIKTWQDLIYDEYYWVVFCRFHILILLFSDYWALFYGSLESNLTVVKSKIIITTFYATLLTFQDA